MFFSQLLLTPVLLLNKHLRILLLKYKCYYLDYPKDSEENT